MLDEADLLRLLLDALADLDCNVLMTIGWRGDPASLEPWPANATVERFVPQADVLPHCSVVVSHGGSGTTYGALAHGLPLLMLPHAADQFDNAAAARRAGVAETLMPAELETVTVHSAVEALASEADYAARAREIAAGVPSDARHRCRRGDTRRIRLTPTRHSGPMDDNPPAGVRERQ